MFNIQVSAEIRNQCPDFRGAAIYAKITNSEYNADLWKIIERCTTEYRSKYSIEDIKNNPVIKATREAYKKLGKDPNRYRPSAEALCRRILRELPLYKINTLVDIINLVSINTGYSIGGFDADKIEGNQLTLDVGKSSDTFEAIGRGVLNINGLPVYKDRIGGIGTPTSDHERTKLSIDTKQSLIIINGYNGTEGLRETTDYMISLLKEFTDAKDMQINYF